MGPLVVFFPEENSSDADKTRLLSPSCSSRPATPTPLLSKARSTISICALLLLTTIVLFALSTIEPTIPRRFLSHKSLPVHHFPDNSTSPTNFNSSNWFPYLWGSQSHHNVSESESERAPSHALQRMGTLYRRGTGAMRDLAVGHVEDDTTDDEFKLFLRVMHRSGLTSRADIVFIFATTSLSSRLAPIIHEENESFFSLIHHYRKMDSALRNDQKRSRNFDVTKFLRVAKKRSEMGEPLWGKRKGTNLTNPEAGRNESESDRKAVLLRYGSVLSFDPTELDPEISLAGFLDQVPLSLRRWACYPMLLGRVKQAFRNIMLVDVKNLVVVEDPLGLVKNRKPNSVFLYSRKQGEGNSDQTQSHHGVNTAIIMGGARGIQRLSNAMVLEIVRVAIEHHKKKKKKNTVSDSAILSQLVRKAFMSKSMKLITSSESIPDTSSLFGNDSAVATSLLDYVIIQRGAGDGDLNSFIKKHLCSSVVDSYIYRDC